MKKIILALSVLSFSMASWAQTTGTTSGSPTGTTTTYETYDSDLNTHYQPDPNINAPYTTKKMKHKRTSQNVPESVQGGDAEQLIRE